MKPNTGESGFGAVCGPSGTIERFVRDDLELAGRFTGRPFKELLDSSSRAKAQAFFDTLRFNGTAFDWELDVVASGLPETLNFVGSADQDRFLVCGTRSSAQALEYLEAILDSTQDADALIRNLMQQMVASRQPPADDGAILDELSRLNNELVNAQRQLHKQARQLQQVNEEKNRALGIVAHDLRNPISILRMYSDYLLLTASDRLTMEEQEFVATMRTTADSMSRLVNDVLDTSAIEAGQLKLTKDAVALKPFLQDRVKRMQPLARQAEVELLLDISQDCEATIQADAGKLEQVLNNLLDNAIKFSPAGEPVRISLRETQTQVVLEVTDQGPGIEPEILDKLFRPFTTSTHADRGKSGTGLGLSIARRIVEEHGGSIEVHSTLGEGTRFQVRLPGPPRGS